jgi:hypothetical protein
VASSFEVENLLGTVAYQQAGILLNDVNDKSLTVLQSPESALQLGTIKMQ